MAAGDSFIGWSIIVAGIAFIWGCSVIAVAIKKFAIIYETAHLKEIENVRGKAIPVQDHT